ncbi:hypothetical protein O3P69_017900 [Scylla paramamosain]|uniref:Carboxypeptidase Q n=2 Tax=Scylla paramamosain TaxID=85552 RepID=A0AAW0TJB9_SCYPA
MWEATLPSSRHYQIFGYPRVQTPPPLNKRRVCLRFACPSDLQSRLTMRRRASLRTLLAACLAVHVGCYVVERGDTRVNNHVLREQNLVLEERAENSVHSLIKVTESTSTTIPAPQCVLPPGMAEEIQGYQEVVDRVIDYVTTGDFKGQVYSHLANLVDTFGPRMTGTGELEAAIDWMVEQSIAENLDNVHTEDVQVPHWVRNNESAWMTLPRLKQLHIMGLGSSVGTPPQGITADVLVVKSFDELKKQGLKAAGKIVVFNPTWESYGVTVQYRSQGASEAAKVGAVAALVVSITPFSIASPHTGQQYYSVENKIPVASVTLEDAAMMERMQARGQNITVKLIMGAKNYPDTISRNTVAEILGTHQPKETVLVSGHLDSWDVTQGAMDDGGGMMMSWAALVVMRKLNIRPRRTVRAVLWTGEEQGLHGGIEYFKRHQHDHEQFQLIMESDSGTFTPQGISFSGTPEATCIMEEVLKLFHRINATQLTNPMTGGPDIAVWEKLGVPTGERHLARGLYYSYLTNLLHILNELFFYVFLALHY